MTIVQTEPKSIKIWSTAVKKVTIWPNGTEKQIRPAWWQPWANTVLYLPFKSDLLDHSWNSVSLVTQGSVSIDNATAKFNGWYIYKTWSYGAALPFTVSLWVKFNSIPSSEECCIINSNHYSGLYYGWNISLIASNKQIRLETLPWSAVYTGVTAVTNTRYYVTAVIKSGGSILYLNGTQKNTTTGTPNLQNYLWIGTNYWKGSDLWKQVLKWNLSEVVIENKVRTAQEVSDYYNSTKSLYWIS